MSVRVLLCEDHGLMRESLRLLLETEPDLEVVGEAATGAEALEQLRALTPEVVLMDVAMPGMNGIETTRRIRSEHPQIKVLALSLYADSERVDAMIEAGAAGYVAKTEAVVELTEAIRAVASGRRYFGAGATSAGHGLPGDSLDKSPAESAVQEV